MFSIFNRNFDSYIEKTMAALARRDGDAAADYLMQAVNSDANGWSKVEDLAWARIIDHSYHLVNDYNALSLFALNLNLQRPASCIGWLASAKVALQCGSLDEFEPLVEKTESLVPTLSPQEAVEVSICILLLWDKYRRAQWEKILADSVAAVREKIRIWQWPGTYGETILERIERADKVATLRPDVWRYYKSICEDCPKLSHRASYAEQKLNGGKAR